MMDWENVRETLIQAIDQAMRERQAEADLQERLNIGHYVLRSKERSLGVSVSHMNLLSRKDIPGFLAALDGHSVDSPGDAPAANQDRLGIDPRD